MTELILGLISLELALIAFILWGEFMKGADDEDGYCSWGEREGE